MFLVWYGLDPKNSSLHFLKNFVRFFATVLSDKNSCVSRFLDGFCMVFCSVLWILCQGGVW